MAGSTASRPGGLRPRREDGPAGVVRHASRGAQGQLRYRPAGGRRQGLRLVGAHRRRRHPLRPRCRHRRHDLELPDRGGQGRPADQVDGGRRLGCRPDRPGWLRLRGHRQSLSLPTGGADGSQPRAVIPTASSSSTRPPGKLEWYYQAFPDDFHDWDLQISPVYTIAAGHPVVLAAGKGGFVFAFDPASGTLLWKTAVGIHNGHDDDDQLALEGKLQLKTPYTVYPGEIGGVETNMAAADGVVYVPVVDAATTYATATARTGTPDCHEGGRRDGRPRPGHGEAVVGDEAAPDAAGRRHGLERPGVHGHLHRRGGRPCPAGMGRSSGRRTSRRARTRRWRSPGTRCSPGPASR